MTISKIKAVYFSATRTTQKVVRQIVATLSKELGIPSEELDFTLPQQRQEPMVFDASDFVVFGVPVYAGRVPNVLVKYLNTMQGNGATALSIAVYGNRDFDDALIEATDILGNSGMKVIAGGAFVGEHSFSTVLAAGRPDADDLQKAAEFARLVAEKIQRNDFSKPQIKGVPFPKPKQSVCARRRQCASCPYRWPTPLQHVSKPLPIVQWRNVHMYSTHYLPML